MPDGQIKTRVGERHGRSLSRRRRGLAWRPWPNIPDLPPVKAENLASYTANSATQCRSNPVSGRGLPKTGIFQISAGDYQRFRSHSGPFRSPETNSRFAKTRHCRAFLSLLRAKSPCAGLAGWGGRIRTSAWWNQNPLPYGRGSAIRRSRQAE